MLVRVVAYLSVLHCHHAVLLSDILTFEVPYRSGDRGYDGFQK
jgi:hypothetical protein